MKLKGKVTVVEINGDEKVNEVESCNVVVENGKQRVAQYINGNSANSFEYMAIGSDTTSESVSDSQLGLQTDIVGPVPHSVVALSGTNYGVEYNYTYSAGAGGTQVTEMGIFDGDSGSGIDTMLNRVTFEAMNNQDYELDVNYVVEIV